LPSAASVAVAPLAPTRGAPPAVVPAAPPLQEAPRQDADARPLLSETIRQVMEEEGVEAATRRFREIHPDRRDDFRLDMEGMADLGREYMMQGEMEKGTAVMQMVAALARESMGGAMPGDLPTEPGRPPGEQPTGEEERGEERVEAPAELSDEVVRRFSGIYRDPDEAREDRRFFLAEDPCGGAMMFGAMWGDAQNTYLRVESGTVLQEAAYPGMRDEPLRLEATLGPGGKAQRLEHDATWFGSPLVRDGDLPEDWNSGPCTRG